MPGKKNIFSLCVTVVAIGLVALGGAACSLPYQIALACEGSLDDLGFNQAALQGADRSQSEMLLQSEVRAGFSPSEMGQILSEFIKEGKDLIIAVGNDQAASLADLASLTPGIKFGCIDASYDQPSSNLRGATFVIEGGAALAGYLAAAVSQTGKVATFGGMNQPPVLAYMQGFAYGVERYNQAKGTSVAVLGMDRFIGSWSDQDAAAQAARELMAGGADILMPVAGSAGRGALNAAQAQGGVLFIGVDTDWYQQVAPALGQIVLTSVIKNLNEAVYQTISAAYFNTFTSGTGNYVGTLVNNGVSLAPFYVLDSRVSTSLKQELDALATEFGPNNPLNFP